MTDFTESRIAGAAFLLLFGAGIHSIDVESYILGGAMALSGAIGVFSAFRFCFLDGRIDARRDGLYWMERAMARIAHLEAEREEAEKTKHLDKHL